MRFTAVEGGSVCFAILFLSLFRGTTSSYEWRCSPLDTENNKYYLPDFGGITQVLGYTWEPSNGGVTYIYSLDGNTLNCSGTVTAVEFCYTQGSRKKVFTLLTLTQQNNRIVVTNSISVKFNSGSAECAKCCATMALRERDQFDLPSSDFLIGMTTKSSPNLHGLYSDSHPEFTTSSYSIASQPTVNNILMPSRTINQTLRLMWLHITPFPETPAPPDDSTTVMSQNTPSISNDNITTDLDYTTTTATVHTTMPSTIPSTSTAPNVVSSDISTINTDASEPTTTPSSASTSTINTNASKPPTTPPLDRFSTSNTAASIPPTSPPSTNTPTINTYAYKLTTTPSTASISTIHAVASKTPTMPPSVNTFSGVPISDKTASSDVHTIPTTSSFGKYATYSTFPEKDTSDHVEVTTSISSVAMGGPSANASRKLTVGGAIGAVVILIVIITVLFLLVLLILYRRKKERSSKHFGVIALDNLIYDDKNTMENTALSNHEYDYSELGPSATDHKNETPSTKQEYEAVQHKTEHMASQDNYAEYDDIYTVPASNIVGLYEQLETMVTDDDVSRNNIILGDLLGSGQFGDVHKGVWKRRLDNLDVAVKTLKEGSGEDDKVKFLQEAAIMAQFTHPNVVIMYGVVKDGEPALLVLEMLKKGDLRNYLHSMKADDGGVSPDLDGHELLSYCRQVASGMMYLSNKAFVHRDLAARNILVSDDRICKIADFGMSRDLEDENYYVSHGGMIPVKWTAPEALFYKKYSTASDVWSYGAVMYEIWSLGHKPFENKDNSQVIKLINSGYRLPPPPRCPRPIYGMMMSCWHPEASGRPNFNELATKLSVSNSKLLHEDKTDGWSTSTLGADLTHGEGVYENLQNMYSKSAGKKLKI